MDSLLMEISASTPLTEAWTKKESMELLERTIETGKHAVAGRTERECCRHWEALLKTCIPVLESEVAALITRKSPEEREKTQKVFQHPSVDRDLWLWLFGELDLQKIVQYYYE